MVASSGGMGAIERVRWTSSRQGAQEDDEDKESILLGGVPLVAQDDSAPISLEDPWWVKLLGIKSGKKAVVFAVMVMCAGLYLIAAGTVQERLTRAISLCQRLDSLDTSRNSLSTWLDWISDTKFHKLHIGAGIQKVDRKAALECAALGWPASCTHKTFSARHPHARGGLGPQVSETVSYEPNRGRRGRDAGPYSDELRLPMGVALGYHQALSGAEAESCADGDIFHFACYTATTRQKRKFAALRESLGRLILALAGVRDEPLQGERSALLHSLLEEAQRNGVMTEISRPDLNMLSARTLKDKLEVLEDGEKNSVSYADIMLYPGSNTLLYRGSFIGLKFSGKGTLYYQSNHAAYDGEWLSGRMHGYGSLSDKDGNVVWDGYFDRGRPSRPAWVL